MEGVKLVLIGKVFNVVDLTQDTEKKQLQFLEVKENGKVDILNIKVPKDLKVDKGEEVKLVVEPIIFNNKQYFKYVSKLK